MQKVVFVPHCILNHCVRERDNGDSFKEVVKLFADADVGMVQLPCPDAEAKCARKSDDYRMCCRKLSARIICQVKEYMDRGFRVVGILGMELSPVCGVYRIESGKRIVPGKGILTAELEREMMDCNFQVAIISVNSCNIFSTLEKLSIMLRNC